MKRLVLLLALFKCLLVFSQTNRHALKDKVARCQIFDKYGVKTFEDEFYHFDSSCGYTLAEFLNNNDLVSVKINGGTVGINVGGKQYELKKSANKEAVFISGLKTYRAPSNENGIEISKPGRYLTAHFSVLGLRVKWNTMNSVNIEVDADKNTNLSGICSSNEKANIDKWSEKGGCSSNAIPSCSGASKRTSLSYCRQVISDPKYRKCVKDVPPTMVNNFLIICMEIHCNCKSSNKNDCLCGVVDAFSKTCSITTDQPVEWRKPNFCPIKCPAQQEYRDCAPRQKACGEPQDANNAKCVEGCVCPLQLYLHDRKCIPLQECPCYYEGQLYPPGRTLLQDCKNCVCKHNNEWICPKEPTTCKVDGDVHGDPHYATFDKKRYDFMGKCVYYLVKGIDFAIKADHYVWEHGKYVKNHKSGAPSFTKILYLEYGTHEVVLKSGPQAIIGGKLIKQFPYVTSGIIVNKPTKNKIIVELPNLVEVHWDGGAWAKVRVPTTMRGRIGGLLGNFNKNPDDDFMLPNGTITTDPNLFGHSWLVEGSCVDENTDPVPHPCSTNPTLRPLAEKACAALKTNFFTNCTNYDAKLSYESCIYDCCLISPNQGEKCSCTGLADHADKCSLQQWRKSVPACEVPCPKGQVYNYCINPCESSCEYLNLNKVCNKICIEGCGCPPGQTFNEENECVLIEKCKCKLNGKYFPADFKYLDEGNVVQTCSRGRWVMSKVGQTDKAICIPFADLQNKCKGKKNTGYTACKNPHPRTCKSMYNHQQKSIQNCIDGCECNEGFMLDTTTDTCVTPESCPCFYNGQSYKNSAVKRDLNKKCVCKDNKWQCTQYTNTVAKCSVFGDIHVRNLDGKIISFRSSCEYILAQATLDKKSFTITTKKGDITITYTDANGRSSTISVKKNGSNFEKISHTSDFKSSKIAELENVGIKFAWNREGWFHIHFDNRWKNKIEGFCAHLENPNETISEDYIRYLTNNWPVDQNCLLDVTFYNSRKDIFSDDDTSVSTKCELLKSKMFNPCNEELSMEEYYNACLVVAKDFIQNSDEKGAEEFYCQLFSVAAQECNDVGLPVNWRSKDQCPFACAENGTKYSSCISTCTCESIVQSQNSTCQGSLCVEGCITTVCPTDTVYTNNTFSGCASMEECAEIRCTKTLINHPKGCRCVKGEVVCTSSLSTTPAPTPDVVPEHLPDIQKTLLKVFNTIQEQLAKFLEKKLIASVSPRGLDIFKAFKGYLSLWEADIKCLTTLTDFGRCKCDNGLKSCSSEDTEQCLSGNKMQINTHLILIQAIQAELSCLLSRALENPTCACVNAQLICPNDKDTPIRTKIIYENAIEKDKSKIIYYYLLNNATLQLKCLIKDVNSKTTTCSNGKRITITGLDSDVVIEYNAKQIMVYTDYIKFLQEELLCYLQLEHHACKCKEGKQICPEKVPVVPQNNKIAKVKEYVNSSINIQQIYKLFESAIHSYERMYGINITCDDKDGEKTCHTIDIAVPSEKNSTCGVTKCPPHTKLLKKCPTCCPTCVQYCTATINGKKVVKLPGEKWSESACKRCECSEDKGDFYISCSKKECNDIKNDDIEYKVTHPQDECCPILTPIGCKHQGKVLALDSVIKHSTCETISCTRDVDGTVIKKIDKTICDKSCPKGFEYQEKPGECCGTCKQIGCLGDGELKLDGSTWFNENDNLQYTCKKINNVFVITAERKG